VILGIFWCFVGLFGNAVDGGFLGDFFEWISWGKEGEDFAGLEELFGEKKKKKKKRRRRRRRRNFR
jgi:hypothetical protein